MNFHQLQYALAVAKNGLSVTNAAAALGTSLQHAPHLRKPRTLGSFSALSAAVDGAEHSGRLDVAFRTHSHSHR